MPIAHIARRFGCTVPTKANLLLKCDRLPMTDQPLILDTSEYGLLTDLYQLTMAACYVGEGLEQRRASFEVFCRNTPDGYGYLVAMGLAQVVDYLQHFSFGAAQISSLKASGIFDHAPDAFWSLLAEARFTGDVWAVPEGTVVFPNEPLLRIEAPLWQAQIIETYALNALNYQTLIATRAARLRDLTGPKAALLEFGTRRAFSPQGSMWAARAAIAGGLDATSNVLAAMKLGRKPSGTMAHALVMALSALEGSEQQAFTSFHRYFPKAPLLIDTFDSVAAARSLAQRIQAGELELDGVRLDSGDLVELSKEVRSLLPGVPIIVSGDLNEAKVKALIDAGACIDGYGFGTKLVTGAPVNGVYKLVEIDGIPTMKASSGKSTYPGRKQIFRSFAPDGTFEGDRLGLMTEDPANATPLLELIMQDGQLLTPPESLDAIAQRTAANVHQLPANLRAIANPPTYFPTISTALQTLTDQTLHRIHKTP
ncbi:nicotinate phosphoribosyltransferase [Leptolyngbya sp. AN02str]|uniref:nicotinate phosphoribosyltransferase n=1 Tax=Leptolyngbya sp. AN02str TaxID=3423363 RepID=UPI003D31CE07